MSPTRPNRSAASIERRKLAQLARNEREKAARFAARSTPEAIAAAETDKQAVLARRKQRQTQYAKLRRAEFKTYLRGAKDKPCVDCGIKLPPECMDLDHVRGDKVFSFSKVFKTISPSKEAIDAEVAKCDVRCPNCHRLRHYHNGSLFQDGLTD